MGWLTRYGAVLLAASLFLSGLALGHRLAAEHYKGRMAQVQQAQLADKLRLQKAADAQVRAVEHQEAGRLATISQRYHQELQNAHAKTTRLLAELRDARRLYIPVQLRPAGADHVSRAAAAASLRDGQTRAELSAQAAEFLVFEAARADQITRQLAACQAVVRADRRQR